LIEAAVLGRVGIDLYPDELRTPLRDVRHYTRYVGGFAGNICTGLARLGVKTAIVSRVGDDGHGEFVRAFLESEGVDCRYLSVDSEWGTPPTFCEIWPPDDFPLTFYRHPTAPDWQLQTRHFDPAEIGAARVLFATGTGLAQSPSRETTLEALLAHQGGTSVFDIDYRPPLWDDPTEFGELAREAAGLSDVVVGNREEVAAAGGLDVLLELAPTVILKRGGDGAVLYDDGEAIEVPGVPVDVVNGLGAGDAFGAALGYAIVRGIGLREGLELANRAGAWVAQRIPCSEAMPRLADLSEVGVS
jgi:5-dehydro-2-deoxygluconokinase